MSFRILLAPIVLLLASIAAAAADPAADLRELDRQLAAGEISKAEHEQRWRGIIETATRSPSVPRIGRARTQPRPTRWEFSTAASAAVLTLGDDDAAQFGLDARLGYRALPQLLIAVGIDTAAAQFDEGDDNGSDFVSASVFARVDYLLLPAARVSPYLGGTYGWVTAERDYDGGGTQDWDDTAWSVHVGLLHTLRPRLALRYEISHRRAVDADAHATGVSVGVSFGF